MKRFCVLRQSKLKTISSLGNAYCHNYRTSASAAPEADPSRRYLNQELCDGLISQNFTFNEIYDRRVEESKFYENHPVRKNSVPAIELVLSFSNEMKEHIDLEAWKKINLKWLKKKYGDNLISAMYHDDEYASDGKNASPHIHAIVLPFDEIGQLNASKICGNKIDYLELQDEYAREMSQFGLIRGNFDSGDKHIQPKEYHAGLRKTIDNMNEIIPKPQRDETAIDFRERLEEALISIAADFYQKDKDKQSEITKLKSEVRNLKDEINGKISLENILDEKGYEKKKKKLYEEVTKLIASDEMEGYRTYDRLFHYLGLDHDNLTGAEVKRARDIAAKGSLLEKALHNYSDQTIAKEISDMLANIFREERMREKALKEKARTELQEVNI